MVEFYGLEEIYKETKFLDTLFLNYGIEDLELIKLNALELLVEIGEFANETRCFKYWSKNQVGIKEKMLEEYIDCLFMILCFCNKLDIKLEEVFGEVIIKNLVDMLLDLYDLSVSFSKTLDKEVLKKLLNQLLGIAKILEFNKEDLMEYTRKKSIIIQSRMKSDY